MAKAVGKITQVIGAVVDVQFEIICPRSSTPGHRKQRQDTGPGSGAAPWRKHVRTIAMDATEGLVRGQEVTDTRCPIMVPVGNAHLGRILNVWVSLLTNRAR